MRMSKANWTLSLVLTLFLAGRASAQCRVCDPFMHCISAGLGAMVCIEGPGSCAMVMPCLPGGGGKVFDEETNLTTWSLFDAAPTSGGTRAGLRAALGSLALGEEARAGLDGRLLGGRLADVAVAHGRHWSIRLVDAAGDGFAIKRAVEGARVHLEVREVRGELAGAVLASESLGERDQLNVPVRVEGRDRMLVLQAGAVRGGSSVMELSRLRRSLYAAGRVLPRRLEPLLRASEQ